jgi:hypothetical protein
MLRKWSVPSPSTTPATRVAPRSRANSLRASPSGVSATGSSMSMTSSGHSTRSYRGRSTASVAAKWARSTSAGFDSTARNPRLPPPWTMAVSMARPSAPPSGATSPTPVAAAASTTVATTGRIRPLMSSASATASAAAAASRPRPPPMRAMGASGPATWPRATPARGSPSKGHAPRSSSTSTSAAGKATSRPARGGTSTAPTARNSDSARIESTPPGPLNSMNQNQPTPNIPSPASHPSTKRPLGERPSSTRYRRASPTNASGHHPKGGSDSATSTPASTAST